MFVGVFFMWSAHARLFSCTICIVSTLKTNRKSESKKPVNNVDDIWNESAVSSILNSIKHPPEKKTLPRQTANRVLTQAETTGVPDTIPLAVSDAVYKCYLAIVLLPPSANVLQDIFLFRFVGA